MNNLKRDLEGVLDDLNLMMLPGTLYDCFEVYRESLLHQACEPFSEELLFSLLREMKQFRGDSEGEIGFNDIFDPLLGDDRCLDKLPIGHVVTVPATPISIVEHASTHQLLGTLAEQEVLNLVGRLESFNDNEVGALCKLASAGHADSAFVPSDRKASIRYIAVNGSIRIRELLSKDTVLLRSVQPREIEFGHAISDRRQRLREYVAEKPEIFEVTPRSPEYFIDCYTEDELRAINLDVRTLALSPRIRHLGVCRRCLNRLIGWQKQFSRFEQMSVAGSPQTFKA